MTQNVNSALSDQKNQVSVFRIWVNNIWIQNCEEHLTYGENPYILKDYWAKFKWFLKKKYKEQRKIDVSKTR